MDKDDKSKRNGVVSFISREEYEEAEGELESEFTTREYDDPEPYSETADECRGMSEFAKFGNGVSRLSVPRDIKRKRVVSAFEDAFELIGGVPRLAHWADTHPTDFFKLYARLLPVEASQKVTHDGGVVVKHILPKSNLDE